MWRLGKLLVFASVGIITSDAVKVEYPQHPWCLIVHNTALRTKYANNMLTYQISVGNSTYW